MSVSLKHLREVADDLYAARNFSDATLVSDAIAEIERLRAQNVGGDVGWEEIETAPANQRVVIYRIHPSGGCDQTAMAWKSRLDGLWFYAPQDTLIEWAPTHWRPLADAPKRGPECGVPSSDADNLEASQALT